MQRTIALAGNPNSGKTTLFNLLTGANQYVGNWPGVTVEKKEGILKGHKDVTLTDLPGIYSLSPYTPEEVVARTYLTKDRPQAIINIVDGTNIERNLYLTTQLMDLDIPMVVAVNMMDAVRKEGQNFDTKALAKKLGCPVVEISALKNQGIKELIDTVLKTADAKATPQATALSKDVEAALAEIAAYFPADMPNRRWFALKLLEKEDVSEQVALSDAQLARVKEIVAGLEEAKDDETESIITTNRYEAVSDYLSGCYQRRSRAHLTTSDKIDRVVTNRWLALPIFVAVMMLVYYIAVSTVGTKMNDFVNDGVFGDGFFFLGRGRAQYEAQVESYQDAQAGVEAFEALLESKGLKAEDEAAKDLTAKVDLFEEDGKTIRNTVEVTQKNYGQLKAMEEPDVRSFGPWVDSVPAVIEGWLENAKVAPWLQSLIVKGIVAGVGAVLGFLPQIFVLFLLLAILEACGYMARIAFIMDRVFKKFGLSGKSFIPMLIGTGCSVPAIMASRTIENERDRRMTITTTSFIPCGAKLPVIAMIAGALFGGAWWVSPLTYFIGVLAVIVSGIILKKTRRFHGDAAPFVMELPAYRMPSAKTVAMATWERGFSFIKKAGSVILLSSIFIWFISNFGIVDGKFTQVDSMELGFAATIGGVFARIFAPLGFGDWQSALATVMGLVAKENIVSSFGILFGFGEVSEAGNEIWQQLSAHYTLLSGFSMLLFNLLCAPCFAAIGAIKREMNNARWTLFAIGYQTVFAFGASLVVYQLGLVLTGAAFTAWTAVAVAVLVGFMYLLFRRGYGEKTKK